MGAPNMEGRALRAERAKRRELMVQWMGVVVRRQAEGSLLTGDAKVEVGRPVVP